MKQKLLTLIFSLAFVASTTDAQNCIPQNSQEDIHHIMSNNYWRIWNSKIQKKIDQDIEINRKADTLIYIGAAPGTSVHIEQTSSEFIFGGQLFNFNQLGSKEKNEKYKNVFGTLFNSATVGFFWKTFETEPGRLRFREEYWDTENWWNNCVNPKSMTHWRRPAPDPIIIFCKERGIRIHGHILIWGNRKWQIPNWVMNYCLSREEKPSMDSMIIEYGNVENYHDYDTYNQTYQRMSVKQLEAKYPYFTQKFNHLFERRITDIANYYGSSINSWDICNESSVDYGKGLLVQGQRLCKSVYGLMPGDYVFQSFKTAAKAFPANVKLNINDWNLTEDYVNEIKDLLNRNCKVDIIGSQMHLFQPQQCTDIAEGKPIQTPEWIWKWTKMLSSTHLPIHLSEITITAPDDNLHGRMVQAIIARNLYRIWFSTKNMMGITWWNVIDNCGAPGEPTTSGILDMNAEKKPCYYALDELINHEWRTRIDTTVDKSGYIKFRGFKGSYKISWVHKGDNKTEIKTFKLSGCI